MGQPILAAGKPSACSVFRDEFLGPRCRCVSGTFRFEGGLKVRLQGTIARSTEAHLAPLSDADNLRFRIFSNLWQHFSLFPMRYHYRLAEATIVSMAVVE